MSDVDDLFKQASKLSGEELKKFLAKLSDQQSRDIEERFASTVEIDRGDAHPPATAAHASDRKDSPRFAPPPKRPRQGKSDVPDFIGPYKILQPIGRGGMGQVYMAEQREPVKRRVALKVIHTDTPTDGILARFDAERQALAMMDHQNIAKVLDAGRADDGRPYFAMELVKGIPITDFCDQNRLTPHERLDLFIQTCRAVHHAHQKGILHRDLKPSNILVTRYDDKPVAKVIDFGLAKAMHEHIQLTDKTLFTRYDQVVGTLAYMSPEQAELNATDIDRRSDVYSLGVILYELLTGSTPIDRERLRTQAFDRVLALVREEEAPRPSSRLSNSGDAISGISEQRRTNPRRLSLLLRGDLDWIAVKALEKDRTRRYEGASALADDVERYLKGETILARPPSFGYRLRKVVRNHKAGLLTAATVAGLFVVGAVVLFQVLVTATEKNLRQGVRTTVLQIGTASGASVAPAIKNLHEFPPELVLAELRTEFERAEETQRLPFAFGLAELNDVRTEFLVSQVEDASPDQAENFYAALEKSKSEAVAALQAAARAADLAKNWQYKARLAVLALRLHSPSPAQEMCQLRADPMQRTTLIEECSTWHRDLDQWPSTLRETTDSAFQSALCSALGRMSYQDLSAEAKRQIPSDLSDVLAEIYQHAGDGGAHSAAGWALRQWGRTELPPIESTKSAPPNRDWFVNGQGMTMLKIPAGSFTMGNENAKPAHRVDLTNSFSMCDREVSVGDFDEFRKDQKYQAEHYPGETKELWQELDERASPTNECPVQNVSWYGAVVFCNWLSEKEMRNACYTFTRDDVAAPVTVECDFTLDGYRLPTEAEWEYACRARSQAAFTFGNDEERLDEYAYFIPKSKRRAWPCGQKLPNGFGLFDVHGNVWEWCWDWYGSYDAGDVSDPTGPPSFDPRGAVMRGGGWWVYALSCESASREYRVRHHQVDSIGFRVVCRR